jgi:hypothetical protein
VEAPGVERGPASFAESVGVIRNALSGEESGAFGNSQEDASAPENAAELGACSGVARCLKLVELLSLAEQALTALDARKVDLAQQRLKALVAAARGTAVEGTGSGPRVER